MTTKVRDKQLLGLRSEWIGDSQFRTRVQHLTKSDKLIVDVMEITHKRVARPGTALKIARNFVRHFGVTSVDAPVQLSDYRADKKGVKIRHTYYVFSGVE